MRVDKANGTDDAWSERELGLNNTWNCIYALQSQGPWNASTRRQQTHMLQPSLTSRSLREMKEWMVLLHKTERARRDKRCLLSLNRLCQHPSLHFRGRVSYTYLRCTYMHQVISPDAVEDFLYSDIIALFMEKAEKWCKGRLFRPTFRII